MHNEKTNTFCKMSHQSFLYERNRYPSLFSEFQNFSFLAFAEDPPHAPNPSEPIRTLKKEFFFFDTGKIGKETDLSNAGHSKSSSPCAAG